MIMNLINNKLYIGSTNNFKKRKRDHFNSLRKNKHTSSHLQQSWNKYGEKNFIFIEVEQVLDEDILFDRESSWIIFKKSTDPKFGYNLGIPCKNSPLRKETLNKLLHASYLQHYKDNPNINLEEFLAGKRSKDLKILKGRDHLKKKIFLFNKFTGEKELEFNSITDVAKYFNKKYNTILRFVDKNDRTYLGYFLVREENYSSEKIYKLEEKVTKRYIKKGLFEGNPIECTNLETKEVIVYPNKKEAAIALEFKLGGINKVLYDNRNHYKGYSFKLIKNPQG